MSGFKVPGSRFERKRSWDVRMNVRLETKAMWEEQWAGKTIGGALDKAVERYGDEVGYVFTSGELTYNRLKQTSDLVARGLLRLGVAKGDKVAIWMAGYAEWVFVYFALARIGTIIVPVNTRYRPDEIKYVLNKSKASLLVFKEEANKDFVGLLRQLFSGEVFAGNLPNETLPFLRALIVASDRRIDGSLGFDELIATGKAVSEKELFQAESEVTGDDIAMLQFTSGTTAMPKAAMLFHSAMLRGAWCGCEVLQLTEADRFFSPQPFFHVGGSIQVMLTPIISGCRMIVQPYFDSGQALELMEHQPHYIEYLNHPDLKTRNLVLEKGMIFASPEVNKRVYDEMGIRKLISPYGLTETHIGGTACALH